MIFIIYLRKQTITLFSGYSLQIQNSTVEKL
jgi:hypothetical protein